MSMKHVFYVDNNPEMYYSGGSQEYRCIGHLRGYFSGDSFFHSWFQHSAYMNTDEFKAEFYPLMDELIATALKNPGNAAIVAQCGSVIDDYPGCREYGHKLMTENFEFYLRIPEYVKGHYIYIYCYEKKEAA